ncbi:MAG: hypothetical protein RL597_119, partial [Pseudomonadota bacterium]
LEDALRVGAEAAGDDHAAVLLQRLADGVQRFVDGRIDEAAGVDHHEVRGAVVGRDHVALGAQAGEDALGVDERLGAAEADESDLGVFSGHAVFYRCVAALVRSLDEVSAVLLMTSEAEAEYV